MLKKLTIVLFSVFLFSLNASAGSDGKLVLSKKEQPKKIYLNKNKYQKLLTTSFQRRFRQELVNGIIDQECLLISKNLLKN